MENFPVSQGLRKWSLSSPYKKKNNCKKHFSVLSTLKNVRGPYLGAFCMWPMGRTLPRPAIEANED